MDIIFFRAHTPAAMASALLKKSTFLPTSTSYYSLAVITGIMGILLFLL
jgi:hypothetical protein